MNKLIKSSNYIIFFLALIILLVTNHYEKVTTNILAVLPNNSNKALLQTFEKSTQSKLILLAVPGFDKTSLEHIQAIEKAFEKLEYLSLKKEFNNQFFQKYLNQHTLYINSLNEAKFNTLNIQKELQQLHDNLTSSFFPITLNPYDPLNLFTPKNQHQNSFNVSFVNGHLSLNEFGYFSSFEIDSNITSLEEYTALYNDIHAILQSYPDVKLFSSLFYFVENSQAIKNDVNQIIICALIVLLFLYVIILKDLRLLLNSLITLATSSIIALLVVTALFDEVSIFVLAFGISISSVAIDYMFHHYTHHYYSHHKGFNKEVFLGFLTTIIAFICVSFVSFTLIQQICLFAIVSLLCSYLQFALLYPKIKFKEKKAQTFAFAGLAVKTKYIFTFSILTILVSINFIEFDFDLKNLDYENKKLQEVESFFKKSLSSKEQTTILVQAQSLDELILNIKQLNTHLLYTNTKINSLIDEKNYAKTTELLNSKPFKELKQQLQQMGKKIGFKEDFFNLAYTISELPNYSIEQLQAFGIELFKYENDFFTPVTIDTQEYSKIAHLAFVKPLSIALLFEETIQNIQEELLFLGKISFILIVFILLLINKNQFFASMNFLLFPLAIVLLYSYFIPFNILHLFMLFIIMGISIDYAIYTTKELNVQTKEAIIYSLLSTFAGFGVLVFSSINALNAIGSIASIGVISILILLLFSKRFTHVS